MKKRTLILIFLISMFHFAPCQNTFSVLFQSPLKDAINSIIEDDNGDFIGVGYSMDAAYSSYRGKLWIISPAGDTLSKTFDFDNFASTFLNIFKISPNDYKIVGTAMSSPDFYEDLLIVNLDSSFNVISFEITDLPGMEHIGCWVMKTMKGNHYILSGSSGPNSIPAFISDPYFIKLNSNFDTIKTYHTTMSGEQNIRDFIFSSDSSKIYLFATSYISLPWGEAMDEMVVYDTSFNYYYFKEFQSAKTIGYNNAKWINETKFLMASNYSNFDDNTEQSFCFMDTSMYSYSERHIGAPVIKDYAGVLNTFDFRTTDSIHYIGNKNVIIEIWPQEYSWIRVGMLNSELQPVYERFYGGDAYYRATLIIRTRDGGSLICAGRYDYLRQNNEFDLYFLKVNNEGLIVNSREIEICPYQPFSIGPNPAVQYLIVKLVLKSGHMQISNATGQLIFENSIYEGDNQINISALDPGVYFATVISTSGERFTQKFIKN